MAAISGPVQMGAFNGNQPNLRVTADNQFGSGAVLTFVNNIGAFPRFDLQGTQQTVAGLQNTTGAGVIQNERNGGGGTAQDATLTISNSANFSFNGYMRDEDDGGHVFKLNLAKTGVGTQTLAGDNITYTGATTVSNGTMKLQNANNFNSVATVNSGATLVVADMTNFDFANRALVNVGGILEINSSIPFAQRWNYHGVLAGSATINKTGTGVFGGDNAINFAGTINVLEGRWMNDNTSSNWAGSTADVNVSAGAFFDLRANAINVDELNGLGEVCNSHSANGQTQTLTVGVANGSSTFGGVILDKGTVILDDLAASYVRLTKTGTGTFTLTGANAYSGITTISNGTLQIGAGGATGNLGTGAVTNNAALVFNRSGTSNETAQISGTGTVSKLGAGLVAISNPSYSGATSVTNGSLAVLDGTAWNSDASVASPGIFVVANSGSGTWDYTKAITGNGTFAKGGAGTVRVLNNLATYTGPTYVNGGTLQFVDAAAFASSGITVASGGTFEMNRSGGSQTLSAPVSGAGHFTKNGAGEVVLGAALTHSGTTSVRAGTLTATAANQLSASSVLSVGGAGAAVAKLNGFSQTVPSLSGGQDATARVVNGSAAPATLTVNLTAGTSTFGGTLGGPGANENNLGLVKQGAGTLALTGVSTHTGGTTIAAGTLRLGGALTLPVAAAVWLDATDGATINTSGGGVTSWTNKGTLGASGDFAAPVGSEPGTAFEPSLGGNQVIRFTATGGGAPFDRLSNGLNFSGGDVTVAYIGRLTGSSNQRMLSATGNNWLLGTWGVGGGSAESAYFNAGFLYDSNSADTLPRFHVGVIPLGGTASYYSNGTFKGQGAGQGPIGLNIGGGYLGGPTENSSGDVGELLVFTSVLSASDRGALESYIARKWLGLGASNILPTTGAVSLTVAGAALDVNGVTQTIGALSGVAGTSIELNGGSLTAGGATNTTYAGAISDTLAAGVFTKAGSGALTLTGALTMTTLTAANGTLNIYSPVGTGSSTINANATTNIYASQTLDALNIADGVEVTFGDGLPFADRPGKAPAFGGAAVVPEPGSLASLALGLSMLLARRRRPCPSSDRD